METLVARVVGGPPSSVGGMVLGGVLWSEEELYAKVAAKYGGVVEVLPSPPLDTSSASASDIFVEREELIAFYSTHDPSKVSEWQVLLLMCLIDVCFFYCVLQISNVEVVLKKYEHNAVSNNNNDNPHTTVPLHYTMH